MKKLYDAVQRFCARHPRFGIPNLMLYIVAGNVIVYLLMMFTQANDANALAFLTLNTSAVLKGELWRIITYVFVPTSSGIFWLLISLYFYYWIGSTLERQWGTAKFTLYYISGVLLTAVGVLIASLTFGINSGAYVAEIVRAGILAVDKGQMEAGRSLGLNKLQTMRYIIIPQAFKSILPPLGNEFIVLIKETSIVGYVGMSDLTRVANQMTSKLFDVFTPLLGIAFIYFVLTKVLSILLAKLERRLRKSDNR